MIDILNKNDPEFEYIFYPAFRYGHPLDHDSF